MRRDHWGPVSEVEFGVLGPLLVGRDGVPIALRGVMLRRLLAVLLCTPGQPVAVTDLIDELGTGTPPPSGRKTLQVYVRRLRLALGDDRRITHDVAGVCGRGRTRRAGRGTLRRAGGGQPGGAPAGRSQGAEVADVRLVTGEARRLEEQRLLVYEELVEVDLDRGRHAELICDLAGMVELHPYREGLRASLMLALCRSGRRARGVSGHA